MPQRVLVTGGAGLVGSECCRLFAERGWKVFSVDNYLRGKLFGDEASTRSNVEWLTREYDIDHYEMDIRDEKVQSLIQQADAIIHTAAQPSHPRSIEIPIWDFEINCLGTLYLLEAVRKLNKKAVFVYCSTNKVYGDMPNYFSYRILGKRFEPVDPQLWDGFNETLRVDQCLHTPFGVSKLAADLYVQEYARLYGLKAGSFRMCCITGGQAKAVELHNWEPYFIRKALTGEPLTIYGYGGHQVRDVIHARDLAKLFYEFVCDPRSGEVYNIGGGRGGSISLLEAIDLIESITGRRITFNEGKEREGDHKWYISDIRKARSHYKWDVTVGLRDIFREIYEWLAPMYEKK